MSSPSKIASVRKVRIICFGKVTMEKQRFDLITQPLNEESKDKISIYKKINNYIKVLTPMGNDFYEWQFENNKLYLAGIYFQPSKKLNFLEKIFKTEKLEASWLNGRVKVLVENKEDLENERKILTLTFENGICVSKEEQKIGL